MRSLRLICSLVLIAAFPVEATQAEEAIALRYKMSPGDRLVYRITEEEKQSSRLNGIPVGAVKSTAMTVVAVWTVERVDDAGNFHIRSENQRLRTKINMGSANFEYDSAKPEEAKGDTFVLVGCRLDAP